MLDDMYIAMLKGDTLSGRPSSGSYVNQIHDNITLVFEHAIKEGILVKNPCDAANPPKMDTREKRAMKPEQIQELIEGLDPAGMPSMAQDRVAQRKTEVEEFAGTVRRLAAKHDIQAPQNEWLYRRIRDIEASW